MENIIVAAEQKPQSEENEELKDSTFDKCLFHCSALFFSAQDNYTASNQNDLDRFEAPGYSRPEKSK
jgi:hypothetical protein